MRRLQPPGWPRPRGYANGVAAEGRLVFVAGQIGWDETGAFPAADLAGQVRQALRNVVAVLAEAGAGPEHVARLTWYVTDREEYLGARARSARPTARSWAATSRRWPWSRSPRWSRRRRRSRSRRRPYCEQRQQHVQQRADARARRRRCRGPTVPPSSAADRQHADLDARADHAAPSRRCGARARSSGRRAGPGPRPAPM